MQKINAFLVALLIIAIGSVLIVSIVMANKSKQEDRFSVSGAGSVYAKADIANLSVGFKSGAKKTAAEATNVSSQKMNQIVDQLKKLKIDEKDIKTSDYNLSPVYDWSDGKQNLIGYEVSQTLNLKVRDLNTISDVISKTTEQGANQIGNINFTIDDEDSLKNQVRELAIQKAKEKAATISKQAGMKLGAIKNVAESSSPAVFPLYANSKMEGLGAGDQAVAKPEIQTGQNEIKVDITLTYEVL